MNGKEKQCIIYRDIKEEGLQADLQASQRFLGPLDKAVVCGDRNRLRQERPEDLLIRQPVNGIETEREIESIKKGMIKKRKNK